MAWRADIPSTPTLAANVPISGLLHRGVWEVENIEQNNERQRRKSKRESVYLSVCRCVCLCECVTRPQTSDIPFAMT